MLTGFSPINLSRISDMGTEIKPFHVLASAAQQETFQITVPTLGAVAVATYLGERGVEVEVRDFFLDEKDTSEADIIAVSSTFMGAEQVKEIVSFARTDNPSAVIVLGGPLSWSVEPPSLFAMIPEIDFIVVGEGEQAFYELVQALANGDVTPTIAGVLSRNQTSHNGGRGRLDMTEIPLPEWDLLRVTNPRRLPLLPVETSRGCPYSCKYCSETHYWGKPPRYREAAPVADEIARNVQEYAITTFRFADSCFSAPPKRCAEICDAIYERCVRQGMPVKWSSYSRVSNLTPDLLEKMKRSGCVALDVGVESGSAEMLRRMGRDYSPDLAIQVAENARELDIITNFNIVVGFPGESDETVDETIEMLNKAQPDCFACFTLFVAPNMTVTSNAREYQIEGQGLSWRHPTMTSEEATESIERIAVNVHASNAFPGGEYFAGYLSALGYTPEEVRGFFKATCQLARGCTNPELESTVKTVCRSLSQLW